MKKTCLIFSLFVWAGTTAFTAGHQPYLPKAAITIHVVDEGGVPVSNALVHVTFQQGHDFTLDKKKESHFDLLTDTNGIVFAKDRLLHDIRYRVQKKGWYVTEGKQAFKKPSELAQEWLNPHATNIVFLKKIKNPIPMYVKQVRLGIPEYEKPIGFDLDKGDWVTPYGNGIHTDLIAYAECDSPEDVFNHNFRMTISFPNEKDGIIADGVYSSDSGSRLRSDHMAPKTGYSSEWVQVRHRTKHKIIEYNYDSNRKYYFRIRTKLDEHGNIVSAQYGKIYGDFFVFTYYLNPTPNDRNVEFDPEQNLFGGRDRFAP